MAFKKAVHKHVLKHYPEIRFGSGKSKGPGNVLYSKCVPNNVFLAGQYRGGTTNNFILCGCKTLLLKLEAFEHTKIDIKATFAKILDQFT
jgi:hypothetical protein